MFKTKMFVLAVLFAFASLANATDTGRLTCSVWSTMMSKGLFFNSGTFVTKGPVLMAIPECADKETGLYGNLFLIAPIGNFETGKEVDVRGGRRFGAGGLDVDASVAYYHFGVGPGESMYNTWNGRMRVSHTFDVRKGLSVQPYMYLDYQYSQTLHDNDFAFAGGAVVDSKLSGLLGKPGLSVDLGGWKHTTTWAPNKGPVWSLQMSLGYQVTKSVVFGPRFQQSWGNVEDTSFKPKNMWGVFAVIGF